MKSFPFVCFLLISCFIQSYAMPEENRSSDTSGIQIAQMVVPDRPEQHEPNPADQVPQLADDNSACKTRAEKTVDLISAVSDACHQQFGGKEDSYRWIMMRFAQTWFVPGEGEIVLTQLMSTAGKDVFACLLIGVADGGGVSPGGRAALKATIEAVREGGERTKYLGNMYELAKDYSNIGTQVLIPQDQDRQKFLTFLDKQTYDRYKGLPKTAAAYVAVRAYFETAEKTSLQSLIEARNKIKECEFNQAIDPLKSSLADSKKWLLKIREAIVEKNKDIRCLEPEACNSAMTQQYCGNYSPRRKADQALASSVL